MCKEISSWTFVVNSLYSIRKKRKQLSLNPKDKMYFWKYTLIASQKLRKELKDVCVYADRYSLENVLWNDNLYIDIKDDKLFIDKGVNIKIVNEYFDSNIKKRLPQIFIEAYKELEKESSNSYVKKK